MIPLLATRKKLRETHFFLNEISKAAEKIPSEPEEFEYYLSAFLSAARSVTFALQAEEKDKYDRWFSGWIGNRSQADNELLTFMNAQRIAAIHREGAEVTVAVEYIPITKVHTIDRSHPAYGFQWFGPPGTPPPEVGKNVHYFEWGGTSKEVVDMCHRYTRVLDDLVQSFDQTYPN